MKKRNAVVLLLLIASTTYFFNCNFRLSPIEHSDDYSPFDKNHIWTIDEKIKYRPQDLVVVTADFNEQYYSKKGKSTELVLFDFYNPQNYKIITDSTTYLPCGPKISPDKSKIIFCIPYSYDGGDAFVLYDLKNNTFQNLSEFQIAGLFPIWNTDGTRFFFTRDNYSRIGGVCYFDITTRIYKLINYYPILCCVINKDTIIVFSDVSQMTGEPSGLYFMDLQGNYLSRIHNSHLYSYGFPLADWNNELRLLVYNEAYKVDVFKWKISVTNLDGSYYKNLTPEGYFDVYPYWGPDAKSILFERHSGGHSTEGWYNSKIMKVDFNTSKVSELFNPNMIENCTGVRFLRS